MPGYAVTERLYDGPHTLVLRATARATGRPVVLKATKAASPTLQQLATWQHEFDLLRQLGQAVALELVDGRPTLVMDDVGGLSLRQHLEAGPLDLGVKLRLGVAIAERLDELHARGVVHRDVNPDNVVVVPATGRVQLIDFGIASLLAKEEVRPVDPRGLAGTLAYLAPEQTGRMNRPVDLRADLYALGCTLYELLAGHPPFRSADRLELVHCHLARQPEPLAMRGVPVAVAAVVDKLLAKTPEARYPSAASLAADLRRCLLDPHTPFALARQALPGRLAIPQRLYGRDREVAELLAAFERMAAGSRELLLIGGYSGVGKTRLVAELHRGLAARHGFYAAGKFEQVRRDVPYRAITQAIAELVRQVLTLDDEALAGWKAAVAAALGANGKVVTDLVPEVERLVGPQPPVPELPPAESQNRFRLVLASFVRAFTSADHPCVLFLDDLQWADEPSLQLLEAIATDAEGGPLLIVGAYRENEVTPAHPLLTVIEPIATGHLALAPLAGADTERLVADALEAEPADVRELAEALHAKAAGNPFFTSQLLAAWHARGWLQRGPDGAWAWDARAVASSDVTANVADLMAEQLRTLAPATQRVLQLAACVGARFDLATLAIVHERPPVETAADLWPALAGGLVVPVGDEFRLVEGQALGERLGGGFEELAAARVRYKFAHDQVQAAAYASIEPARRRQVHLAIGRLLLAGIPADGRGERIFEIVGQLNAGLEELQDPAERGALPALELEAGQRARQAAAFPAALGFLETGLALLPPDAWSTRYELALALHLEAAEAAYLASNAAASTRYAEAAIAQGRSLPDKVRAYEVLIDARIAAFELAAAIDLGLDVLALLGFRLPRRARPWHTRLAFGRAAWATRKPSRAPMANPLHLCAMRILNRITAPCYIAMPAMLGVVVCKQVELTARHGHAATSAFAYATYGMILAGVRGDLDGGERYGKLALELQQQPQARVLHIVHAFTVPWKRHAREVLAPLMEAYRLGLETGDFDYAIFALLVQGYYGYFVGRPLGAVAREFRGYAGALKQLGLDPDDHTFWIWQELAEGLAGPELRAALPSAERLLPRFQAGGDLSALFMLHFATMQLRFLQGDLAGAEASAREAERHAAAMTGVLAVGILAFYQALIALRLPATRERQLHATALEQKLACWARHAPANFGHKLRLVQAERARSQGRAADAMAHYQAAIEQADEAGYVQERAIAAELAAAHFRAQGLPQVAAAYLADARTSYARWGAMAKVADLDRRFPALTAAAAPGSQASSSLQEDALDYDSILRALQAISGEIVLDGLHRQLLRVALENAGAQRAVLLVPRAGKLAVAAEQGEARAGVPEAIVNLAANGLQPVLLANAAADPAFLRDPDVAALRSVLALPLVHQGQLAGVLYLENNLATGVFTARRLEVLQLLSAQMAISLSNAALYEAELARREALAASESKSRFLASMSHEIRTPLTAMLAAADLLLADQGDAKAYAGTIRRNGDHLLALINDVLDLSRIEAGRMAVERIPAAPAAILADVESLMRPRALEKGIGFEVRLATPLPASIETDPMRLRQILLNLLSNAIKFTEVGGVVLLARYDREAARLVLAVQDSGIGIPAAHLDRLFTPFEQGDASMTRRYGGSGLGLAISQALATALGGGLAAGSEEGVGSTFTLALAAPVAPDAPFVTNLAAPAPPAPPAAGTLTGRVLLAEDGPDNQVLLRALIRHFGPEVELAANGQLALEAATAGTFDLVLMDMQMPVLDGYTATARLREQGYRGPIVALTAHAMAGERERCLAAGCDDYMSKPVDRTELLALMTRYLRARYVEI